MSGKEWRGRIGAGAGSGARGPVGAEEMIAEARKAFFVMFAFVAVVWIAQLANFADGYGLSREYAVVPGDLGALPHLLTAPFLHWNWAHLESNSGPLFVFGFLAAYRGVGRFLLLSLLVAVTSGMAVWLFEAQGAATVGASGLIFGYFGYVVVRGLFDRHLIDSLVGLVMGASFAYLLTVAVPGTPGVSWLAHLGGLVGGLAGAWLLRDRRARAPKPSAAQPALPEPDPGLRTQLPPAAGPSDGSRADLHKELRDLGLL